MLQIVVIETVLSCHPLMTKVILCMMHNQHECSLKPLLSGIRLHFLISTCQCTDYVGKYIIFRVEAMQPLTSWKQNFQNFQGVITSPQVNILTYFFLQIFIIFDPILSDSSKKSKTFSSLTSPLNILFSVICDTWLCR